MQYAYGWAATGFASAAISFRWWLALPSLTPLIMALLVSTVMFIRKPNSAITGWFLGVSLGLSWMASVGDWYLSWQLPNDKIKQNAIINADVIDAAQQNEIQRLKLQVTNLDGAQTSFRAKIAWYKPAMQFAKGQTVRLCVRLVPARSTQNPFVFDYWQWLVSQNISATGYVKTCEHNALLKPALGIYQHIQYQLQQLDRTTAKWLKAILLADRTDLNDTDWRLLQQTGVAHLFTLSGLHMGIMFGVFLVVSKTAVFMGRRVIGGFQPTRSIALPYLLALAMAWWFVSLCGFPVPLTRAAIALSLYVVLLCTHQYMTAAQGVCAVFVVSALAFPLSVLGISVFLSFFAVCCILFVLWRFKPRHKNRLSKFTQMSVLQLILALFMTIATALTFGEIHWYSALINLVAIPFVSIVIVPAGCIAILQDALFPSSNLFLLEWVGYALEVFVSILQTIPLSSIHVPFPSEFWLIALLLALLILIPGLKYKMFLCLGLLSASMYSVTLHTPEQSATQWHVHVFDVGQGSAILIESNQTFMLVDTGPALRGAKSSAESVIAPYLQYRQIEHVQGVITHFDNDHAGGQHYLQDTQLVSQWRTPDDSCRQGEQWTLGILSVSVLWPDESAMHMSKNNQSCVLSISDGSTTLLIPGDIEYSAEKRLLSGSHSVKANILIAPHHGSKSSSSLSWINAVSPQYVVFTTGYKNRWRFPHPDVVSRYEKQKIKTLNTATDGYLRFTLTNRDEKPSIEVETWNENLAPRWYKSR